MTDLKRIKAELHKVQDPYVHLINTPGVRRSKLVAAAIDSRLRSINKSKRIL
jgi:hypothetical protein